MNPQDPLAALHPLREPPPVDWWPPAPGWWVLAVLALLLIMLLGLVLWRRYRANAYRRRALRQLDLLSPSPDDPLQFPAQLNALLKSVALLAYPRRDVAASSGEQWLNFLNASLPEDEKFPPEFVTAVYRGDARELDAGQLRRAARAWLQRHRRAA